MKCVIFYKNTKHKFYLSTEDGTIEDSEQSFQDFCDFLEDRFEVENIEIEEWPSNLELYSIEDADDIDNEENEISNADDFGDVFEDCDLESDDPNDYTFYFVFKVTGNADDEKINEKQEQVKSFFFFPIVCSFVWW